ncbi:hypothetical protein [Streptomyces chartreusis]|uniref:hypothetical protein n=1 Tax=Streptomyces chartreusis TaxID=1969 RepID=UPI0038638CA4|nr:hypothetical protein OG938_44435 [Streptomyces chartreusis]
MDQALESGGAARLGDFPDTPVRYRGIWWVQVGGYWRAVDDHAQAQFDEDADRYQLAIASVDGLTSMALAHPVSREQLLDYVARLSLRDLPEQVRVAQGATAVWGQLEAPVGCGAWAVAWPPGATADWHHHGEGLAAFAVMEGELEYTEQRSLTAENPDDEARDLPAVPRRVKVGECLGIGAGRSHLLHNPADSWVLSVHVGWLVHPLSCHDHVPGAILVEDAAGRVTV